METSNNVVRNTILAGVLLLPLAVSAQIIQGEVTGTILSYEDHNNYLGYGVAPHETSSGDAVGRELKGEFTIDLGAAPSDDNPDADEGHYSSSELYSTDTDWFNVNWYVDDDPISLPPLALVPVFPGVDEEEVTVRDQYGSPPRDGFSFFTYQTGKLYEDSPTQAHMLSTTSLVSVQTQYGFVYGDSLEALLGIDYDASHDTSPDPFLTMTYRYSEEFYTSSPGAGSWWLTDSDDILYIRAEFNTLSVPEPYTVVLMGLGVAGMAWQMRRGDRRSSRVAV